MFSIEKDGGPAFPNTDYNGVTIWEWMSLRDYFAGQFLSNESYSCLNFDLPDRALKLAVWAYEIADAMLEARNKK